MRRAAGFLALAALLAGPAGAAPNDPRNPTCPANPDWAAGGPMKFSMLQDHGKPVLLAEGQIDAGVVARLQTALQKNKLIREIWLRSPGGDARAGTEAGKLIRQTMIPTRIPNGWACFSACNFMFMGGVVRYVDPGGLFIVHMFTHTSDRREIEANVLRGTESTVGMIGDIEQDSALLASEDNDFLIRMGVSRKLLTEVMYQQKAVEEQGGDHSTRRCLTHDEVINYNVANAQ
jgi:hypothetical protein